MDFPTVRELSRQKNAVRVLKFLFNSKEPLNFTDVYTSLDANDCTILYWLKRLQRFGILNGVRSRANLHSTYYSIANVKDVERIIDRFHWNVGFKLARLISYEKTEASKVREDRRFKALCAEYYLTLDEGIEAVKKCPKIEVEKLGYPHDKTYLYRKSQGYDEPERTREQLLEEASKAIG